MKYEVTEELDAKAAKKTPSKTSADRAARNKAADTRARDKAKTKATAEKPRRGMSAKAVAARKASNIKAFDKAKKKVAAKKKSSKSTHGLAGKSKSAAHKAAISASLKAYHAKKKKGKKTTSKTATKSPKSKTGVKVSGKKAKFITPAQNRERTQKLREKQRILGDKLNRLHDRIADVKASKSPSKKAVLKKLIEQSKKVASAMRAVLR